MLKVNKVHQAVLVAMSAGTASSALHAQAIEEITVTATKRAASMQDVALAVQAMDSQALEDQNIQSFTDLSLIHISEPTRLLSIAYCGLWV